MIHRNVFMVEVFSSVPIGDDMTLSGIEYLITEGPGIGNFTHESTEVVPPGEVVAHLLRIGNDGSFFDDAIFTEIADETSAG